jgi:hypothetical protein
MNNDNNVLELRGKRVSDKVTENAKKTIVADNSISKSLKNSESCADNYVLSSLPPEVLIKAINDFFIHTYEYCNHRKKEIRTFQRILNQKPKVHPLKENGKDQTYFAKWLIKNRVTQLQYLHKVRLARLHYMKQRETAMILLNRQINEFLKTLTSFPEEVSPKIGENIDRELLNKALKGIAQILEQHRDNSSLNEYDFLVKSIIQKIFKKVKCRFMVNR